MGKTKRGLKPSSSSKAVGPKQKRAKLSAQRATELSGSQILFERNIDENSEVSRLPIESSGENSLLNERCKTFIMLQIGN